MGVTVLSLSNSANSASSIALIVLEVTDLVDEVVILTIPEALLVLALFCIDCMSENTFAVSTAPGATSMIPILHIVIVKTVR